MKTNNFSTTKEIGNLGEQVAVDYLVSHGFSIIERNYWRKWGEIDIVAKKEGRVHFVEVKSVSHASLALLREAILRGTWRPEELVHERKLHQIHKALQTWLTETSFVGEWQIDVMAVRLVPTATFATVKLIENVVMEHRTS